MAKIIENPKGRRMVRLNSDDVFSILSIYQQRCNNKNFSYDEARLVLQQAEDIYIPEEL